MARQLRTILVLLLLAGTAAAFVVTEDLKLEPDPIARPRITPTFSPTCRCESQTAQIAFRLRQSDRLTLTIEDGQGSVVRTLLRNASFERGNHAFGWDGRNDSGEVVAEAAYRPTIELTKQLERTIVFPRTIRVDTTPAEIEVTRLRPRAISPDGDGRADALTIRYEVDEPAQAVLLVNGRQEIETALGKDAIRWSPRGRKRGSYRLSVGAVDAAGNRTRATKAYDVRIRYVDIAAEVIRARPRAGFSIQVSTDARRYRWRLGRREGSARVRILRLRAPAAPGRYALEVEVGGRRDSAVVVVRRR